MLGTDWHYSSTHGMPSDSDCSASDTSTMLAWTRQTWRLASRISQATARRTSVHLWTRCLPLYYADVLGLASGDEGQRSMTPNATRVVLHNQHDARLMNLLVVRRNAAKNSVR